MSEVRALSSFNGMNTVDNIFIVSDVLRIGTSATVDKFEASKRTYICPNVSSVVVQNGFMIQFGMSAHEGVTRPPGLAVRRGVTVNPRPTLVASSVWLVTCRIHEACSAQRDAFQRRIAGHAVKFPALRIVHSGRQSIGASWDRHDHGAAATAERRSSSLWAAHCSPAVLIHNIGQESVLGAIANGLANSTGRVGGQAAAVASGRWNLTCNWRRCGTLLWDGDGWQTNGH
jgi:hypothetical protein